MRYKVSEKTVRKSRRIVFLFFFGLALFSCYLIYESFFGTSVDFSLTIEAPLGIAGLCASIYGIWFAPRIGEPELRSKELLVNERGIQLSNFVGARIINYVDIERIIVERGYLSPKIVRLIIEFNEQIETKTLKSTETIEDWFELENVVREIASLYPKLRIEQVRWSRLMDI